MGLIATTFTDYSTPCGYPQQSFFQMLVNSMISAHDDQGNLHCYLNILYDMEYCDSEAPCLTCTNSVDDPERFLVENLFALDECGRLGIKMMLNLGASRQ
jgi:hypothetical protein